MVSGSGGVSSGGVTRAGRRWGGGAVAGSRVVAGLAALCLVAAAARQALVPYLAEPAHPRNWFVAVVCCLLGPRVVAHAPRNAVGWLVLATGFCGAVAVGAGAWPGEPWVAWVGDWVWWPAYSLLPVLLLVFPNGRPPSRGWVVVLGVAAVGVVLPLVGIGWAAWADPVAFWRLAMRGTAERGAALVLTWVGFACFAVALLGGFASLVARLRRTAEPIQRRLLRWTVAGTAVGLLALVLELVSGSAWGAWLVVAAAFPAALVVAILRYGLYDIDLIIHRTLLYGLLGGGLVAIYTAIVLATTARAPAPADVAATVAVVVVLAPLHRALQRWLDHRLFGDGSDPYRALTEVGRRLARPARADALFPEVAESVGRALRLPYVALHLNEGSTTRLLADHGKSRGWPQYRVELRHGGVSVGELVAEARARDEGLSRRDRRLLDDLARQAAPAAHAARLTRALHRANERFERERKAELKRIDLDLHDTIGPSVAGIRNQVDAARRWVGDADPRVRRHLDAVVGDLESLSEQVRRLVRNARPLELSRGLVHAVRRQAERFSGEPAVSVTVEGDVDGIPPAVELAAYLITGEALKNAVDHANASTCRIHLRRDDELVLSVADDGDGVPPHPVPGLGLDSMRKRCEDLGGTFELERSAPGTRITARLPLPRN